MYSSVFTLCIVAYIWMIIVIELFELYTRILYTLSNVNDHSIHNSCIKDIFLLIELIHLSNV